MDYFTRREFVVPERPEYYVARQGYASTMFGVLQEMIKEFEAALKPDEETGAVMAYFGQTLQISVRELAYQNPYVMVFTGIDADGRKVVLLQHPSQVNLLLVPIKVNEGKAHRVGFKVPARPMEESASKDE